MNCIPTVSIIVPVYNAVKTLQRTIDSIQEQSYRDFELLLVDDGSTDSSKEICCRNAEKDFRIRVFSQTKSGVAVARNRGIDEAKGEFLLFVDADDYLLPNYIENIVRYANQYEFIVSDASLCIGEYHLKKAVKHRGKGDLRVSASSVSQIASLISCFDMRTMSTVWNKVFRKSIVDKYSIRFVNIQAEDILFVFDYFLHISSVAIVSMCGYVYIRYSNSLSHRNNEYLVGVDLVELRYSQIKRMREKFPSADIGHREFEMSWFSRFVGEAWKKGYLKGVEVNRRERIRRWQKIRNSEYFKELSVRHFKSGRQRCLYWICRLRLYYIFDYIFLLFAPK